MSIRDELLAELRRLSESNPEAFYRRFAEARVALAGLKPSSPPTSVCDMIECIVQTEFREQRSKAIASPITLVTAIRW